MTDKMYTERGRVLLIAREDRTLVKREEDDDSMNPIGTFVRENGEDWKFYPALRDPLLHRDVETLADIYDRILKGSLNNPPEGYEISSVRKVTVLDEDRESLGVFLSIEDNDWIYESHFRQTDADQVRAILRILDRLREEDENNG